MARPGRRAFALLAGALLLFAVGTNVQAGWLIVLASLMAGAVLAGVLLPPFMVRRVEIQRRAPDRVFQGDEVRVDLDVTNVGGAKLSLTVADPHLGRARLFVPSLRRHERVRVTTRRRAGRRGPNETRTVMVSSSAPFGVAIARRRVAAPGRTIVYPRVVPVRIPLALQAAAEAGPRALARRGDGQDYLGVREYRAGDSMRHVHWPSSARTGSLMVREFEREHRSRLGIVVDASADDGTQDTPLDLACAVAASVAVSAMDAGLTVMLATQGSGGPRSLVPADRAEALEWLAGVRPDPTPLAEALHVLTREIASCDALVLAMPSWAGAGGGWGAFRPSGDAIAWLPAPAMAALVDASSFRRTRRSPAVLGETNLDELERSLRRRGAAAVRIGATEDLEVCLERLFAAAA